MTRRTIDLPPAPSKTMVGFAQGGYSLNTAVADIIDNSINARAKNIWVEISTDLEDNPLIYIWDDGYGMNEDQLVSAMQYGSDDHDSGNELGRFGLGLKAASTAISRSLDVISRRGPDEPLIGANWDMDRVQQEEKWSLTIGEPTEDHRGFFTEHISESGTLVAWEKVYSLCDPGKFTSQRKSRMVKSLESHIGMTFHRFIEDGRVKLYVNEALVEAWNPIPLGEPDLETHFEDIIPLSLEDGTESQVMVRCYALPSNESWSSIEERERYGMKTATKFQGIYVYREDRMIVSGSWLGIGAREPHANLSRNIIDLDRSMDTVLQINYQKSTVSPPIGFTDALGQIIKPIRKAAETKYRQTKKRANASRESARHRESSNLIKENYEAVNQSQVEVQDERTASVTKASQTMVVHIPNEVDSLLVEAAESLPEGHLWQPLMANGEIGVRLNKEHVFYQRVYLPLMEVGLATKALDMLFWSLAALSYDFSFDLSESQMDELIDVTTQKLRKLAKQLPEPADD